MTDHELLQAVARGDRLAFTRLMERHMSFALALAMRMTGNKPDAQEVAQEAFLRVWTAAAQWRPDGGARFTTWLYRVVVNLCLDRRRKPASLPLDDLPDPVDPSPSSTQRLAEDQAKALVAEALATLPDRQRAAMSLCYLGEVSCQEAADILEMSHSALESLLVRGRRAMRAYLERRGFSRMGDVL